MMVIWHNYKNVHTDSYKLLNSILLGKNIRTRKSRTINVRLFNMQVYSSFKQDCMMIIKEKFSAYCILTSFIKNKQDCMIVLGKNCFCLVTLVGMNLWRCFLHSLLYIPTGVKCEQWINPTFLIAFLFLFIIIVLQNLNSNWVQVS